MAGRLRVGFLLTWMVLAGLAFGALRAIGRDYGYFYSTSDRARLWDKLPNADAASALLTIYGNDSQLPEIILARHASEPEGAEPQYTALLHDPTWGAKARLVEVGNFDFALRRLLTNWSSERYQSFLQAFGNGAALDPSQRRRLDQCRRQVAKGMMRAMPASDEETSTMCLGIEALMTRPSMLSRDWYSFIKGACDERQYLLMEELRKAPDRRQQLALLRQVLVEVELGGMNSQVTPTARLLAQQTLSQLLAGLDTPGEDLQEGLSVLACCKVLVPNLEYPELEARLNPEQLAGLKRFAGVGKGSRPTR